MPLPHALQRVAQTCAGSPDHLHHTEAATADDPHELEVPHAQARVLQGDARGQVVQAGPLHDLLEGGLVQEPKLAVLLGRDACSAQLAAQQGTLAEVVPHAHSPYLVAADFDQHQALPDDVEVRARFALLEDPLADVDKALLQRVGQARQLLLGKRLEQEERLQDPDLVLHLQGRVQVVEGEDAVKVLAVPDRELHRTRGARGPHADGVRPVPLQ
mmetsp:Transcript_58343/g.183134  ORF Transcript_58343/g.183134 Transcript_58343/m.183134 type:complete len:215 (-) Transcript_58343:157-801(-)